MAFPFADFIGCKRHDGGVAIRLILTDGGQGRAVEPVLSLDDCEKLAELLTRLTIEAKREH